MLQYEAYGQKSVQKPLTYVPTSTWIAGWAPKPTQAAAMLAQMRLTRAAVIITAALVMETSRAGRAASSAQPACYMRLMTYWNHGNHPAAAGYACVQWAAVKIFTFLQLKILFTS